MGNIRLSYSDLDKSGDIDKETEIIEENNYYPFGLKHRGYNEIVNAETEHKFRFNSTEFDADFDLNWYNMPLRHQDPTTGRWNGIDPVTHFSSSTYSGYENNPVFWADPSGASVWCKIKYAVGVALSTQGGKMALNVATNLGVSKILNDYEPRYPIGHSDISYRLSKKNDHTFVYTEEKWRIDGDKIYSKVIQQEVVINKSGVLVSTETRVINYVAKKTGITRGSPNYYTGSVNNTLTHTAFRIDKDALNDNYTQKGGKDLLETFNKDLQGDVATVLGATKDGEDTRYDFSKRHNEAKKVITGTGIFFFNLIFWEGAWIKPVLSGVLGVGGAWGTGRYYDRDKRGEKGAYYYNFRNFYNKRKWSPQGY